MFEKYDESNETSALLPYSTPTPHSPARIPSKRDLKTATSRLPSPRCIAPDMRSADNSENLQNDTFRLAEPLLLSGIVRNPPADVADELCTVVAVMFALSGVQ